MHLVLQEKDTNMSYPQSSQWTLAKPSLRSPHLRNFPTAKAMTGRQNPYLGP